MPMSRAPKRSRRRFSPTCRTTCSPSWAMARKTTPARPPTPYRRKTSTIFRSTSRSPQARRPRCHSPTLPRPRGTDRAIPISCSPPRSRSPARRRSPSPLRRATATPTLAAITWPPAARLTFQPGETSQAVTVQVVGDTKNEADETFTLGLSNPQNAVLAAVSAGVGTITNDDPQPTLSVTSASTPEGNSETTALTFTVSLVGGERSGRHGAIRHERRHGHRRQ